MKVFLIVLVVILVFLVIGVGWYISGLNYIVRLDEEVQASWAQVENQLQRRNDLIPNLVSTVKGYAAHEKELLTKVTELRSRWADATGRGEKIEAAREMGGVLSRLLLVAENYPDLKANQNFLALQSQLEGTENRIAVERRRYNQMVKTFNAHIRTVFGKFFARKRNLDEPAVYYEAEEAAKAVPKVEF